MKPVHIMLELCEASIARANANTDQYADAHGRWLRAVASYESAPDRMVKLKAAADEYLADCKRIEAME